MDVTGNDTKQDSPESHSSTRNSLIKPNARIVAPDSVLAEPDRSADARWYALYTRSRFEKKLLTEIADRSIEVFLPMREVLSRWKDRKKKIWLPLFPGYIFLHQIDTPENRYRVLNIPGAVRFVGHEGHADAIPDEQIESVRRFLEASISSRLTRIPISRSDDASRSLPAH
jgi:transcription antitermination factor NusG